MSEFFANKAKARVVGAIDSTATSLVVDDATKFPAAPFRCEWDDEYIMVTAKGGTGNKTFTITRGIEGSTPTSHANGSVLWHVLTAGAVDAIVVAAGVVGFFCQNKGSATAVAGSAVTQHSSGSGFVLASAASPATRCIGILSGSCAVNANGLVKDGDEISLADWTAITGTTTLASKADYFLSLTPGRLVTTPPTSGGQIVQIVGFALNPTTLRLNVQSPILS